MEQTSLPFHYAEENESTGMTALSGLPAYLDLAAVARSQCPTCGSKRGHPGVDGRADGDVACDAEPFGRGVGG